MRRTMLWMALAAGCGDDGGRSPGADGGGATLVPYGAYTVDVTGQGVWQLDVQRDSLTYSGTLAVPSSYQGAAPRCPPTIDVMGTYSRVATPTLDTDDTAIYASPRGMVGFFRTGVGALSGTIGYVATCGIPTITKIPGRMYAADIRISVSGLRP